MFTIKHVKSVRQFCDKMLERVYGGICQCVTSLPYAHFELEDEQPTRNILTMDVVLCEKFKEMNNMLKQGCLILAIKFKG